MTRSYVGRLGDATVTVEMRSGYIHTLRPGGEFIVLLGAPDQLVRVGVTDAVEGGEQYDFHMGAYAIDLPRQRGAAMIVHGGVVSLLADDRKYWTPERGIEPWVPR